jgi:TetR/AcrR family transcriptional repressor of nem operon
MPPGRRKAFDEIEVLDLAMNLFWLRGYEALGIAELVEGMGISRQSLYDTFGSKRALFIRVLDHYRSTQLAGALALLDRPGSPLENVRAVLRFFHELATDSRCRGCLVANAIVEVGPHDEEIAAFLGETLDLLQSALARSLAEARARGELPQHKCPDRLAHALTNSIMGLVITGKLRSRQMNVDGIHAGTLNMLD